MNSVFFAFLLTLIAGLSTGIGSIIALFAKKTNTRFLAVSLGFSAGVMIYVSMIEIFAQANSTLNAALGIKAGSAVTVAAFFGGMFLIAIIDKLIPSEENPHEMKRVESETLPVPSAGTVPDGLASGRFPAAQDTAAADSKRKLLRTGLFTALALAIHNFPEGLATFMSGLQELSIAIPIAAAIAIHNIPEGIAVSVPIYFSTGSRKKAFVYSFVSGLSEPVGAIVGYTILRPFINDVSFGIVMAVVAGIMVFISLDELLPSAQEYGEHHLSIYGLIAGMIVMAVSLLLFL